MEKDVGGFLYAFLELLITKDMHHLQELEDQLAHLEDQVLAGIMNDFNLHMTALRKEVAGWTITTRSWKIWSANLKKMKMSILKKIV